MAFETVIGGRFALDFAPACYPINSLLAQTGEQFLSHV